MIAAWWKLVDYVVMSICGIILLVEWWERRETRKLLLGLSPSERVNLLRLLEAGGAHAPR